jgi:hypothetical protein
MGQRLELQALLESLLGTNKVHFQPPQTFVMSYPCIVYRRSKISTKFASNNPYIHNDQYTLTVIDPNPDSDIPDKLKAMPMCIFDVNFTFDNLNHTVFKLTY